MDWISFSWGVGALFFVNIVYAIWAYPKQSNRIAELENKVSNVTSRADSVLLEQEEALASSKKKIDEVTSYIETLESSIKLRKQCPICGADFPIYIVEEK